MSIFLYLIQDVIFVYILCLSISHLLFFRKSFCIHCYKFDGKITHIVIFAVFFVSNPPRPEIHTFSKCPTPGFEAKQSSSECKLWPKDLWFWTGTSHIWNWFYDWICRHKVVSAARTFVKFIRLHCSYRYMVSRVHIYGIDGPETTVSW